MALVLNEEQALLKESAIELFNLVSPITAFRQLRDERSEDGFDRSVWTQMAEMGLTGLTISEEYGGLEFGYVGLGQVLEIAGRNLVASPLISTSLLSTTAIALGGTTAQKESLLPQLAAGELIVALAHQETAQHNPTHIATSATKDGDNYIINGAKTFVLDGHVANKLVVVARTSGNVSDSEGLALFIVDADADGVQTTRTHMMDSRNAARITFDNVSVPAANLMAADTAVFQKTLDIACIGIAAEMLGSIQEAFERTVTYLKERQQFGVLIGSFQALQHRAAKMFIEIELCKSIVIKGLTAIDEDRTDLPKLASLAKAKLGETAKLVSNEAIQMHGGIGMTDEMDIGFFLKRARVAQQTLGDYNYHLDRYARLNGY